ncbi:MAG: EF-P lysine aminoacylase GenX [Halioglobus sp.]|nr:EF-P lysine aminoacylase GenX [Halioglobus sp.]
MQWQPAADLGVIRQRAELLSSLRRFFSDRDILEVETPLLCSSGITDPSIEPLLVSSGGALSQPRFLQTSPEYAMKRMLAAHGQPIFQVARAFRDGEAGSRHNPEFSLLEWYRPGFGHHELMQEVAELVQACVGPRPVEKYSYRQLFLEHLDVDPHTATSAELEALARRHLDPGNLAGERDLWLDLLMSHLLEPRLGDGTFCFVYDYPVSQAALAQVVNADGVSVGQRFELYVDGVELANGYCELTDAAEQRQRFERDNALRLERGQQERPVDEYLLAALAHGLPSCSGVALGVDRLLMLMTGTSRIQDVLAFDWTRC